MTVNVRRLALAIVLAISVFSAGVATGGALATTLSAGSPEAPALLPEARGADGLADPKRCHSSLGPEDYQTCKEQFGEE